MAGSAYYFEIFNCSWAYYLHFYIPKLWYCDSVEIEPGLVWCYTARELHPMQCWLCTWCLPVLTNGSEVAHWMPMIFKFLHRLIWKIHSKHFGNCRITQNISYVSVLLLFWLFLLDFFLMFFFFCILNSWFPFYQYASKFSTLQCCS